MPKGPWRLQSNFSNIKVQCCEANPVQAEVQAGVQAGPDVWLFVHQCKGSLAAEFMEACVTVHTHHTLKNPSVIETYGLGAWLV